MFSPYYARARRRGAADPREHVAFNVACSGRPQRWSMTERPRSLLRLAADTLSIGRSAVRWDGSALRYQIDETTCPVPRPLRGAVTVRPLLLPDRRFALDPDGLHTWTPYAPRARVRVDFELPRLSWEGEAYFDGNRGERPLEQDFRGWTWSRVAAADGTRVYYEVQHRRAATAPLALHFDLQGMVRAAPLPAPVRLPRSAWGIARQARADDATRVRRTLVDAPFYARSVLATRVDGAPVMGVHESLDLDRFRNPWVQRMLPFRMPRWPRVR